MQATAQADSARRSATKRTTRRPGFWRTYVFSTDHKVIGIQYGITALCFLLFGFFLMMMMRWQIAHPGEAVPVLGPLLAAIFGDVAAKGIMSPDLYNSFGAMHGTIMVFLAIVPLAFGAFGNYVVPLQIGAPDMAFPRLNMASYQVYCPRRRDHVRQLLHSRRRGPGGLDLLFAAGDVDSDRRPDLLADRHGVPDHLVAAGLGQFHRHHHPAARAGHDLDAAAVFRLGAVRRPPSCCCWPFRRWKPPASCS